MGLFDIFGGGGSDEVSTKVEYPKWMLEHYRPMLGDISDIYQQQTGQGGLNPAMQQALAQMRGLAGGGGGLGGAGTNALQELFSRGGMAQGTGNFARGLMGGQFVNPAMAETQRIAMGGDVGKNPWLNKAYNKAAGAVTRNFNEALVPAMDQQFAQSGRLGSGAYAQMRGSAEDRVGDALSDLATGIYGGAYEGERGRQMGALGQLGQLGQQDVANRMGGAGMLDQGTQRQLQGIGLGGAANQMRYDDVNRLWQTGQMQQQAPWGPAQTFAPFLTGIPGLGAGSSSQQPGQSPFQQGLQGALGLGQIGLMGGMLMNPGAYAGMMSDRRVKEDIKRVGKTDKGLPIYSYKYKGTDGPTQLGIMAQDALKSPANRNAVIKGPEGLYRVLYDLVA